MYLTFCGTENVIGKFSAPWTLSVCLSISQSFYSSPVIIYLRWYMAGGSNIYLLNYNKKAQPFLCESECSLHLPAEGSRICFVAFSGTKNYW